jgi:hypothetical protein
MMKSHTKQSCACANLMKACTASKTGMMQVKPKNTSTSQRCYWFVFDSTIVCMSSFIFTTKNRYFVRTHLAGDSMEIHLVFTLHSIFKPLVSRNLAKAHCSRCLFSEDEK